MLDDSITKYHKLCVQPPSVSFDLSPDVLLLVLYHTIQTRLVIFMMMLMYDKYNTEVD